MFALIHSLSPGFPVSSHEALVPPSADALARLRLDGKVAIVTGGTRGIGLAIAATFARAGASVVVSSRKADHVDAAVRVLQAEGHRVAGVVGQHGHAVDAHAVAARTVEHFDGIDIIVNNAATNPIFGPLQQATDEAFEKIFGVNEGLELCRTAHGDGSARRRLDHQYFEHRWVSPEAGLGLYSMSKAALISPPR
jgi:NAD(P)-dependent dehydrogenase (short-subunit alcohol dehydrogenase family)